MFTDFRDEWLSKLGERINIPTLAFDEEGLCQISLDQELVITVYKNPQKQDLVIFGQLPVDSADYLSADLLHRMLIENRHHSRQVAPVVSLSAELDAVEVHYKLSQSELEAMGDVLDQLIDHLEYWRGLLQGGTA